MSVKNMELATAIAEALAAAQRAGLPLDIKVGVTSQFDVNGNVASTPRQLTDMDEKLLRELKRLDPRSILTLTDFAAAIGIDEDAARSAMRGAGRSTLSVKDELYERFDTPRADGNGKVRTYRLTQKGREFVKTM